MITGRPFAAVGVKMNRNWEDISYLKNGSDRQRKAYDTLRKTGIFTGLNAFSPILAGTIPIEIYLPESDLDIICEVNDVPLFRKTVCRLYSGYDGFSGNEIGNVFIVSFNCNDFRIEIFAKPMPVKEQEAYRHMIVEYRLLKLFGEPFRKEIIRTKSEGLKTEPAFCKILGIKGDPYRSLLKLENCSDDDLLRIFGTRMQICHVR